MEGRGDHGTLTLDKRTRDAYLMSEEQLTSIIQALGLDDHGRACILKGILAFRGVEVSIEEAHKRLIEAQKEEVEDAIRGTTKDED